jgi:hypothetical protein
MSQQQPTTLQNRRSFRAIVTPITDLDTPRSQGNPGTVAFTSRKSNGIVTMQFEPFSARLSGPTSFISVRQSIGDLPPHTVNATYILRLNGNGRVGIIKIDPLDSSANIKFYIDSDESTVGNMNDLFQTEGGVIQWIENY